MKPLLCRLGLHSPCKTEYIEVTRRRSDRHGGKYHTNYIVCRRCGKLCYRMRSRRESGAALPVEARPVSGGAGENFCCGRGAAMGWYTSSKLRDKP